MDHEQRRGDAVAVPPRTAGFALPSLELPPPPKLSRGRTDRPVQPPPAPIEPPPPHPQHSVSHPQAHPHAHAHVVVTPTPAPACSHDHGPGHGHSHASGHAHAPARAPLQRAVQEHAQSHAHAHSHAGGACDGSHGLFDAHHHDWSHLAMNPHSRRMLQLALYVQGLFLLVEVVGGIITNSLALLGDAAHMLADVGALALALYAARLAARPADARRTWGMPRAEYVAAAINSGTLVLSCIWIAYEAIHRLLVPEDIHGQGLILVAVAGLAANALGAYILGRADSDNVNIRAAMMHLLVDAASSVGVIIAGIVIYLGGPVAIDTIASLLIAFLAVRGTWPVLRSSLDSLLDAAPAHATATDVARVLGAAPGVRQVHDVHVWEPGPRRVAATAHVLVAPGVDIGSAIVDLRQQLQRELGIDHATLQVATDRRVERHDVERVLLRDDAVERAIQLIEAARPSFDPGQVRSAVQRHAAHVDASTGASPVRLMRGALAELER